MALLRREWQGSEERAHSNGYFMKIGWKSYVNFIVPVKESVAVYYTNLPLPTT